MSKRKYVFEVEVIEAGQRRRYGDSHYHYIVESEKDLQTIENFCKKVLKPAIPSTQYRKEDNCADNHFRNFFTKYEVIEAKEFLESGKNKVEYKVVSPSTC